MKLQNLIHILIGIACFGLLPQMQAARKLSRHRTGAIPASRQRKAAKLFKTLPRALEIQELAGVRSFQPVLPTSTPASVLEHWSSTPRIPIPQWALQRCY